jgi:hypothetical protein
MKEGKELGIMGGLGNHVVLGVVGYAKALTALKRFINRADLK